MKIKYLLPLIALLLVAGCSERTDWVAKTEPVTQQERDAVSAEEARILSNVPHSLKLEGHDQEWYKTLTAAHEAAIHSCCTPRLFEYYIPPYSDYFGGHFTGRYKSYSEIE